MLSAEFFQSDLHLVSDQSALLPCAKSEGFSPVVVLQIPFWTLRIWSRNSRLSNSCVFFLALFLWHTSWKEAEKQPGFTNQPRGSYEP